MLTVELVMLRIIKKFAEDSMARLPALASITKMFRGRGRPSVAPQRDTRAYATLIQVGAGARIGEKKSIPKASPRNLRYFAKTPIARRAVNAIKNPVAMLEWEVEPLAGIKANAEIERQIEIVKSCLQHPNNDDSFRTLVEQVVEDILCGAGAIEQQPSGDPLRPLWLWPVDGLTIQVYPFWSGKPNEVRYAQTIGFGTYTGSDQRIDLRNDELMYIRPNPSTSSPFGTGPLEVAFMDISRLLATGEYVGNLASNQRPGILIDLGDVPADDVSAFRAYWQSDVEGQGKVPITGFPGAPGDAKSRGINVVQLYPEGDNGMYLKYQEFLIRTVAAAFDISPANLSVERDVNRSTAETGDDRDWAHAIRPMAALIASHLNREAIHGLLGFSQIEFRFKGIDREDEDATSQILTRYYDKNVVTPNEIREKIGLERSESQWADLCAADVEIAKIAARGVGMLEDDALGSGAAPQSDDPAQDRQIVSPDAPGENKPSKRRARPKADDPESTDGE